MERLLHKYIFHFTLALFLVSCIVFSSQVLAVGKPEGVGNQHTTALGPQTQTNQNSDNGTNHMPTGVQQDETTNQGQSHAPAFAQVHLQAGKLHACQVLSKNITTRSTHMNSLVTQMEKIFDSIAQGMENHYVTKLVPQRKTVANYDSLVAAIQTQKSALLPLLAATQTDIAGFTCDGNNPAAQLTQYRTDMQGVIQGLQVYKKAVRNLIVAIASVVGTTEKEANSPISTVTPIVSPTTVVSPTDVTTTP